MRRRIRIAGSLAVPALLGLSLLAPVTAEAAVVTSGNYTAVFNYPKPGGAEDYAIMSNVAELIDLASADSTIYMGMYAFNSATLKTKLLDAQTRGVTLRIVAERNSGWNLNTLQDLEAQLTGDSTFTWCQNSCLGNSSDDSTAISHDKYLVLTALSDGRKNVVWQSSQNLAGGQSGELNNALVVANNATLAGRYIAHYEDQVDHAGDSVRTTYSHTTGDPSAPVEAFFFPRNTGSDASNYGNADVVASFIDQVDCARSGRIRISAPDSTNAAPGPRSTRLSKPSRPPAAPSRSTAAT